MELTMNNGFYSLNNDEMENVNGGAFSWAEVAKALLVGAAAHPVIATVVIGGAAYGCWCAGQVIGKSVGEFIYNCNH